MICRCQGLFIGLIEVLVELILLSPLPFNLCLSLSVMENISKSSLQAMMLALLPVPGFSKVVDCQDSGLHLRLEVKIRMEILNVKLIVLSTNVLSLNECSYL